MRDESIIIIIRQEPQKEKIINNKIIMKLISCSKSKWSAKIIKTDKFSYE